MATIDFNCLKCEGNFETDAQDLVDGTEDLECPHCGAKPGKAAGEDFVAAIAELLAQVAAISKKFTVSMSIDAEDLADGKVAAIVDDDADEEEEDDDEDDDDDDSDDDDDDDEVVDEPADD